MKFLNIIKKRNCGYQDIFIPLSELKALFLDREPKYVRVIFENDDIEGFTNLEDLDSFIDFVNNELPNIFYIQIEDDAK